MKILNIIEDWTKKNPNSNLESYATRESLSHFIQHNLKNEHTWNPKIESSNDIINDTNISKKIINDNDKLSYLNSIKSIIKCKDNEQHSLFENMIYKFNIKDEDVRNYIHDYILYDDGTEEQIKSFLQI